jgi:hypothetical protein
MAYFNAHAAVAAAFLPHNMAASAAGGPLALHPQTSGKLFGEMSANCDFSSGERGKLYTGGNRFGCREGIFCIEK